MSNDFLPFGTGSGANVIDQATYAALAARSSGFAAGTAVSAQLNKAWRQSSIMAAVLGAFIVDTTGQNAVDDGTTATLLANLKAGVVANNDVARQTQSATAFTSAGTAPAFTLTPVPAITAYAANQRFRVKFHAAGAGTLNVSGQGAKNLKQYDSTGAKTAAVTAAGQLADVEYDGTDMVILDPLPPVATGVSVQGAAKNLRLDARGINNYNAVLSADELVLENGSGQYIVHRNVLLTANANGTVGAINSLDTGTLAASTWYGVFDIYNPTTATFASLLSAVTPTPATGSTAGGALAAATYYVRIAYVNANGISLPSQTVSQAVSANNLLTVTSPAALTGATGYNVYVGTAYGNEQLQNASPIAIGTNWTEPTGGLIAGVLPTNAWPTVMPSGYTYRAFVDGVRTDSSGSKYLLQTLRDGKRTQYAPLTGSNLTAPPTLASGASGTFGSTLTSVAISSALPPWAKIINGAAYETLGSGVSSVQVSPNPIATAYGTTGVALSTSSTANVPNVNLAFSFVLEYPAVYYAANLASSVGIVANGWE